MTYFKRVQFSHCFLFLLFLPPFLFVSSELPRRRDEAQRSESNLYIGLFRETCCNDLRNKKINFVKKKNHHTHTYFNQCSLISTYCRFNTRWWGWCCYRCITRWFVRSSVKSTNIKTEASLRDTRCYFVFHLASWNNKFKEDNDNVPGTLVSDFVNPTNHVRNMCFFLNQSL